MIDTKLLIAHSNPKSPVSEAFRVLRTNLQFSSIDKHLKIFLITSPGVEDGKTTITANLAVTMAQAGSKVLVIDGDLRKPRIHKIFGISNNKGLTNILASQDNYRNFIHHTEADNLDLLASGPLPPNPSELVGSYFMKKLLEEVKNDYDFILIDTPPVGTVTDAAVLSTISDGTILVANSGKVEIKAAQRAKELLLKVNANIIGVVLNKINIHDRDGYYYNYYYEEENQRKKKPPK